MTEKHQQEKGEFFQRVEKKYLWCMEKLQSFGEWVTSTPVLSFFVIISFFLILVFVAISFFCSPEWPDLTAVKTTAQIFGVIFGFLLVAQRLDAMSDQTETKQSQHEVDLFKEACELLGHKKMVTRMGGITLLGVLTKTDPETWHIAVVDALANFIRVQSTDDKDSPVNNFFEFLATEKKDKKQTEAKWKELDELKKNKTPTDIEEAIRVIACDLTDEQKTVVQKHLEKVRSWPDLSESWLCRIKLTGAYLPKANLKDSFLSYAHLIKSDLTGAELQFSHLDRALFSATALQDAMFFWANLTDASFREATGLKNNRDGPEGPGGSGIFEGYYIKDEEPPFAPNGITEPPSINIANYWKTTHLLRATDLSTGWKIFDKMFGGGKKKKEGKGQARA